MKTIIVESLDKNKKTEILETIDSLKNLAKAEKEFNIELNSSVGDYNLTLEITDKVLSNQIKVNVTAKGVSDISTLILLALAKQTGGTSSVYFTSEFQFSDKFENSKDSGYERKIQNIVKALKHLKCDAEKLEEILKEGKTIYPEDLKKYRVVREVQSLPPVKKNKRAKKDQKPNVPPPNNSAHADNKPENNDKDGKKTTDASVEQKNGNSNQNGGEK